MKNKKKWKSLNRRGLAALLTLAMCLGTVPFTAFAAEDTHEHNQNGWNCEWVEPEQELNCQHEHDEDCYVPGEPVLECTEDHHEEDCYVPGEDVLTCENEDEDHEHDEDCYASGEAVLECDEDHHTEDCYAPGEPVLDCRHEHGEDCFSAAEGFWSCTPPVEDAADEADKDVVEDEDQFDNDGNQGAIVEDETFEDDDQTDVEDEGVFNDDEQQNDVEDEDEALIPDEVQAFLDAVAAIPEITPENAEEVAEYVYGEVSEYYEALLGTEYEDREDVQEAVEVYAAAVEAVDAVLDMESNDFAVVTARPYRDVFPNGVVGYKENDIYGTESSLSGDTFVFNTLPIRQITGGWNAGTYYPDAYYYELKSTYDPDGIIDGEVYYSVGSWTGSPGYGMPCFQVNIDTKEGVVGTANVKVLLVYYIGELRGLTIQTGERLTGYFSRTMNCTINVSEKTYTVTYTDGVTGEVIFTDQITRGLKFTDSIPKFQGTLERKGHTFKGWTPELMETVEEAVSAKQADDNGNIVYTAQWEKKDSAPEAPERTDLYGILRNFVEVVCVSDPADPSNDNHKTGDSKKYCTWTRTLDGKYEAEVGEVYQVGNDWMVDVKLNGDVYAKMYSLEPAFGTGVTHTLAENEAATKTIILKWDTAAGEWKAAIDADGNAVDGFTKDTILAAFKVVCKAPETLYTVVYTDGVDGSVFGDETHGKMKAGAATPSFSFNGGKNPTRDGYIFTGWLLTSVTPNKQGVQEKVAAEDANADHEIIYTAQWQKNSLSDFKKVLVATADELPGSIETDGITFPNAGKVSFGENTSITLLYKITVTGTAGMAYEVTDEGATWVGGALMEGIIPESGAAVIYVTRTFNKSEVNEDGKLVNTATVTPGTGDNKTTDAEAATPVENAASIKVTKTIEKQITSADGEKGWTGNVGKLKNTDVVRYTVTVTNDGALPLKNLEFFDDMDVKLTNVKNVCIDTGWTATYDYYEADGKLKPLLYIAANETLPVNGTVKVQYEATVDGVEGTKGETVENYVNVYAKIAKAAPANHMSRMRAAYSDGVTGGAGSVSPSDTMTGVGQGSGGNRPDRPTDGVSGGGGTSTGTENPPIVVPSNPALSVTKKADKTEASVGETITYTVTVTNTGDVALKNVTVADSMADKVTFVGEDSFEPFDLAVGETKTIKYTYVVTTDDAGKTITNDVSVTSDEVKTPVPGSATVTVKPVEPENVTITIEYVDENGGPIGSAYTEQVEKGEYDVSDKIVVPDGYAIISIKGELKGTTDEDVTITVTCGVDARGNDNGNPTEEPDGIPDVFQPIVTYIVTGGTWEENDLTEKKVVFNLVDEQGNPVTPTLNGTIPTPVVNAATNTEDGAGWTGTVPAADTEVTKDGATYRYVFPALEGMRIITVNRVHNGNTIVSIPVTVPDGEAYTVTDADAPAAFDNGGNHYIRIDATLPTVPAGRGPASVNVYYTIDNIGGGTNGSSPDGIPDGQQAVVYYRSSNTAYGTVRDAYQMFDLRPDIASREETLRNAATVVGRARFTNWTMGSQALSTNATLENAFTVEAGHTYTVTANFTGYTGGGSSGGGGGGGGGGGSSSGNTSNNNNTNNDTTTNDDTVTINDAEVPLADLTSLNREDHFAYVSGYTDGTVRPTNNITREEVAAIFYRLLTDVSRTVYETGVNNFSDVDSSRWSNNAISTLANAGIISGYKEGTFKPGQTITRAEFAAIASRFDSVSENVTNPFTDTEGHWAEQLISNAADKGWVGGYPDSTFRPSNAITRAEAMTLINKVLNREVDKEGLLADAKQWPDNQEGKWYYYQVLEATNSHDYERRSADSYVENWTAITQK
ncbi:MAG: DUF11 domain-containing protein [Anaerotignum sp.]|nr:DUF11 domain-containing protein [Anaerotignum sp.]